jgi:ABC-2 type transport system permease protein
VTQTLRFTGILLRAYVRDRAALFFTFFLPFLFMIIFGFLNFGGFSRVDVGVVDGSANADSDRFIAALRQVPTLRVTTIGDEATALRRLRRSELDMALVIPSDFRIQPVARSGPGGVPPTASTVQLFENQAAPQESAVGRAILSEVIDRVSFAAAGTMPSIQVARQEVSGVSLRYVDFLVPGILGMNVMQLNIFSVAFALVAQRQRGVLRRIFATPLEPGRFLAAHGLMRLGLSVGQVLILLAVAFALFQVRIVGSLAELLVVAIVGAIPFLMQGFAIAGWARTENQVPPVANLITLPQFFLSGVFFPKEAAPEVIRPITNYLPLTLLNDALREISAQGASLWDERMQLLGLAAWAVVSFVLAVRLLRVRED